MRRYTKEEIAIAEAIARAMEDAPLQQGEDGKPLPPTGSDSEES